MTTVTPTVEVFFDQLGTGGDFLTLDDPVKGELDEATYPLFNAQPVDITSSAYSISINRGRMRELDEIVAGTCAVRLRNYDGTFLPADLDSLADYAADAIPGKRVRVSVDSVPIFDGVIDDWDYEFAQDGRVDAGFVAVDALASLARMDFDEWTTTGPQTAGPRLGAILDRSEVRYPYNRDIDDGTTELQSDLVTWGSNVLNYAQLVAKSELGRLFASANGVLTFRERLALVDSASMATFSDDGTGIGFSGVAVTNSSELLYNRVGVDREGGTLQTSENLASQAKYGVRTLSLPGLLLDSDAQSALMADFLANIYAEPQTRIAGLTVYLDGLTDTERAQVVDLDLADVVSVTWTPRGADGGPVTQLSVVEGVSHEVTYDQLHAVTLRLSPLLQTEVIVLDDVALGILDIGVLAY